MQVLERNEMNIEACRELFLQEKCGTVLCGFSGGADSTESLFDVRVADGFYRNLKKTVRNLEDDMQNAGEPTSLDLKALKQIKMGCVLPYRRKAKDSRVEKHR